MAFIINRRNARSFAFLPLLRARILHNTMIHGQPRLGLFSPLSRSRLVCGEEEGRAKGKIGVFIVGSGTLEGAHKLLGFDNQIFRT